MGVHEVIAPARQLILKMGSQCRVSNGRHGMGAFREAQLEFPNL
jgi:hypothetical protein